MVAEGTGGMTETISVTNWNGAGRREARAEAKSLSVTSLIPFGPFLQPRD